jgi:hypothetical protein
MSGAGDHHHGRHFQAEEIMRKIEKNYPAK